MKPELKPSVHAATSLKAQLRPRLEFSKILTLSEPAFAKLISDIEQDPLFQKLIYPPDRGPRAIFRRRFPRTRLSKSFYEIKEEIKSGSESVDVQSLLEKHSDIIDLIKTIGQENFEKNFLYRESPETPESIAIACGISVSEVQKIQSMIMELSIRSEFFHPTSLPSENQIHFITIAKLDLEQSGEIYVSYLSPHLACGRYVLNRERLESVRKLMQSEEKKSLSHLVRQIEWINLRQDTLQKILDELTSRQENYLRTNSIERMLPISQREMAHRIGVSPSTVSRAIFNKSLLMPWGEEAPIKNLFINKKGAAQQWIRELLEEFRNAPKKLRDRQIADLLHQRYHLRVSRRSVNLYRRAITDEK